VLWTKQGFHFTYLCEENKGIKLQSWPEELKLSRLLLQGIIELKMNKNHRKTPE